MIICDTSIWIEYFRNKSPYSKDVASALRKSEILGLECIFGELLQGVNDKQERKVILDYWESIPKTNEKGLWLEAGEYSAIHGLPGKGVSLVDAFIAIAAFKTDSKLWTLDKKLLALVPGKQRY